MYYKHNYNFVLCVHFVHYVKNVLCQKRCSCALHVTGLLYAFCAFAWYIHSRTAAAQSAHRPQFGWLLLQTCTLYIFCVISTHVQLSKPTNVDGNARMLCDDDSRQIMTWLLHNLAVQFPCLCLANVYLCNVLAFLCICSVCVCVCWWMQQRSLCARFD